MTPMWRDLQAAGPAIRQGWIQQSFPKRGRYDFDVHPTMGQLFVDIARDRDVAREVMDRLESVPPNRQFVFAVYGPSLLGCLAYFGIVLGAAFSVELYVDDPVAKVLLIILSIGAASLFLLFSLVRGLRMQARYADALLINRLLRAVEAAQLVEDDPVSVSKKYYLADTIRGAAEHLCKNYPPPSSSVRAASGPLRQVRLEAKRCSAVINSYGVAALSGSREQITALKEDLVRAILRVGTGNWAQIANLQPFITVKRSWVTAFKPSPQAVGLVASLIVPPLLAEIITNMIIG